MINTLKDGSTRLTLSRNQYTAIQSCLFEFKEKLKCSEVLLADASGLTVARNGNLNHVKSALLCSLAANNYAANAEIASIIGESQAFASNLFEGEFASLYIQRLSPRFMIVVVFDKTVKAQDIKTASNKLSKLVSDALDSPISKDEKEFEIKMQESFQDDDFRTEILSKFDNLFKLSSEITNLK